jgi:hypothetical protein
MTIKITEQKADGARIMECFNCFERESAKKVGAGWEWNKFNVQEPNHQKKWDDLKIICLNCGHSHPRYSLGLAKYKHLGTIHLCLVTDGDSFGSRCGMLSGSVAKHQDIEEITIIPKYNKMCKKCAREEGVSLYSYNNWYSEKDKELELKFYRHL